MVSMNDVVITDLPSVKLSEWRELPYAPAIYFVIAIHKDEPEQDHIAYIGQAKRLVMRFRSHHRMSQFEKFPDANIAWIPCSSDDNLTPIEQSAIDHFKPTLNGVLKCPKFRTTPPRTERITLKISSSEKAAIKRMADSEGLSISDFIRGVALDRIPIYRTKHAA